MTASHSAHSTRIQTAWGHLSFQEACLHSDPGQKGQHSATFKGLERIFLPRLKGSPIHKNENGMVTAVALLLLAVLALLGTTAVVVTSTDILIGGNYKISGQAFYAAEAGTEEARGRLRSSAGANHINDSDPTSTQWRAYIGTLAMAQTGGFN
jgi:hypothetical protein